MDRPTETQATPAPRASAFWTWACRLIVALVVVRGLALACVLPPLEAWDEYQHVGYVEQMHQGKGRPVLGEATIGPELMTRVVALPQPHSVLEDGLSRVGAVGYDEFWTQQATPVFRGGPYPLYQAQHGPVYYRLTAPLFAALGGIDDLRSSVAGLRLLNVGLTALAVALVLAIARRITRSERLAALLVLPLAMHPLFLFNGARVANDALGVALATLAIGLGLALALGWDRLGQRAGWCGLALGVATGLAVQAKATNLALLPFVAACWLVHARRARRWWSHCLLTGVLVAAGFLAAEGNDLAFNLTHYSLPTAMQEAIVNRRNGRTPADLFHAAATFRWNRELPNLWAREIYFKGGWSFLRTATRATLTYQFLIKAGLAGWVVWGLGQLARWLRPDWHAEPVFVAATVPGLLATLVLCYTAALAYHMVQSKLAWGAPTTCAWYACPAVPWFLALVAAGSLAWPLGRFREALPWALAATGLAGEIIGVWGAMVPTYTGFAADWPTSLHRLAWLQPPALGTTTLLLALVAELAVVAALVLTFRDEARPANRTETALFQGPHARRARSETPSTSWTA